MEVSTLLAKLLDRFAARRSYKFIRRDFLQVSDLRELAEMLATTRHLRNLRPLVMDAPLGKRLMVVAPHEDDEIIGPGGTLLKSIRGGAQVRVVYLTHADELRRQETLAVARRIGYEVEFLDYPANAIPVSSESARRFADCLARSAPAALMLPFLCDDHPDHQVASRLLYESYRLGFITMRPEVWAYQVYSAVLPNVIVNITDVADDKAAAIRGWRESAMKSRDWAHFALGLNAYNSRLLPGHAGKKYVEAFFVVPFVEYMGLCARFSEPPPALR